MKNVILCIIAIAFISCKKTDIIPDAPHKAPQSITPALIADTIVSTDSVKEVPGLYTYTSDSVTFGYNVTELNSGYTTANYTTVAISKACSCFCESHMLIKDYNGNDLIDYTFTETPAYIESYNKNTITTLAQGYNWWFRGDNAFNMSSVYFLNHPELVSNAKFTVDKIALIKISGNISYYIASISLSWETPSQKYIANINAVITIQ